MEFRAPTAAARLKDSAIAYLTKNLTDPVSGKERVENLMETLGNAVDSYPDWHPILTTPPQETSEHISQIGQLTAYNGCDHTILFAKGFVTCPYVENKAQKILDAVDRIPDLTAYRLTEPLYANNAFPVVVFAKTVSLDADGTIRSRDALAWFVQLTAKEALSSQVAETWWNIRSCILGNPHGSQSSLFVNQHTGLHMRKILEAMNKSGMFGPIKESSLDMLSEKKRKAISYNLISAALKERAESSDQFEFELCGEICKVSINDTWDDGHELSIRVMIGDFDLHTSGFYYKDQDRIEPAEPRGKRTLAEKFI